jgi:hypothetical protein
MGSGQMIITMGALALLSLAVLNVNNTLNQSDISLSQNRYRLEALSLLTSYIEQASQEFFDEASTDTSSAKNLSSFTLSGNLGFELNDNNIIDDFDDYHNYTRLDTGRSGVIFRGNFKVDYVTQSGTAIAKSTDRQYHKRMTIYITDGYTPPLLYRYTNGNKIRDTLRISFVQSYWFYN